MRGDTGSVTLTGGEKRTIPCGASNYLYAYSTQGLVAVQLFKDKKPVENPHTLGEKYLLTARDFDEIQVTDLTGSNNTVRFFYGQGDYRPPSDEAVVTIDDSTPIDVSLSSGSITIDADLSNQVDTIPDVTVGSSATALCASNSDRLELLLTIKPDQPNGIRIGDAGVLATSGAYVGPGESRILKSSSAWYGIRDGGSDVVVTLTELESV